MQILVSNLMLCGASFLTNFMKKMKCNHFLPQRLGICLAAYLIRIVGNV